jgi:23S rRNA pseudouridine2605 synthase
VTNPAFGLEKRYRAVTKTRIAAAELAALAAGPLLDDGPTRPARARLVGHRGPTSVVELTIHEGRKHQVRRMFAAVGRPLKELRRVALGPLELGALASGAWRRLAPGEVRALAAALRLWRGKGRAVGGAPERARRSP